MTKGPYSIVDQTSGKSEVVATRLTEKDAIKQSFALMEALGGNFRAITTATLRMAGHAIPA